MELAEVNAVVLASGASNRFGSADKLLAPLGGKPITQHVGECIASTGIKHRYLVAPRNAQRLHNLFQSFDFKIVVNPEPESGQGSSLAIGARTALAENSSGVLVCLADMPFITLELLSNLGAMIGANNAAICATKGRRITPPALFSEETAYKLEALSGDLGAKNLVQKLECVARLETDPAILQDIDTPEDLVNAQVNYADALDRPML